MIRIILLCCLVGWISIATGQRHIDYGFRCKRDKGYYSLWCGRTKSDPLERCKVFADECLNLPDRTTPKNMLVPPPMFDNRMDTADSAGLYCYPKGKPLACWVSDEWCAIQKIRYDRWCIRKEEFWSLLPEDIKSQCQTYDRHCIQIAAMRFISNVEGTQRKFCTIPGQLISYRSSNELQIYMSDSLESCLKKCKEYGEECKSGNYHDGFGCMLLGYNSEDKVRITNLVDEHSTYFESSGQCDQLGPGTDGRLIIV